jgi:uncharacterized protein YjbI with pentapeptide repeats
MLRGPCGRDAVRDDRCIFHLENKTRVENGVFARELATELEKLQKMDQPETDLGRFVFSTPVVFANQVFPRHIRFVRAVFEKEARFSGAVFKGEAHFSGATFQGEADFAGTTFEKGAGFHRAVFERDARFSKATFKGGAHFNATEFAKVALFSSTTFKREAEFYKTKFNGMTYFRRARFLIPQSVVFDICDLSKVSFLHSETISEVSFRQVKWRIKGNRSAIVDEDRIGKKDRRATYSSVADVYRRLRRSYESRLRYAEAGEFFKSEMEMKRMAIAPDLRDQSRGRRVLNRLRRNFSAIAIYKLLSLYGESWTRVAIWIVISIALFAVARTMNQSIFTHCYSQVYAHFRENIVRSVFVFFQLRSDDLLDVLERVWSGLLLGLTYIALRRQLERH